jgi:chemotaxis signal transduction protein/DNA-binding NarL/FixJ family response regulator/ABC-type nitrate/sulfonate/bicarbonate transport system substrate-binding protein
MPIDTNMKILLVEDTPIMRRMEIKILKQLGYEEILEAGDGKEAIEKLQTQPDIRLVISDWNMPIMDGFELLLWIRSTEPFSKLPFLMASGHADKKYVNKAMANGASGMVTKPFSPDELKMVIQEAFGIKQEAAPAKSPVQQRSTDGKTLLRVAHIQITDHLALGVLKSQIATGQKSPHSFALETCCMPNWNLVQAALEKSEVDAACILIPAAMDLYNYGVPLRLTLLTHRNGSIMVRNKLGDYRKPYAQFFKHKTFFIPHKMSIHNMLSHKYFSEMGLRPGVPGKEAVNVLFDVVAPINMPEFLADNTNACGFMVAEPIGSRAINAGIAEKQFLSSEVWNNHPCCALVFRQDVLQKYSDSVHEFTEMLVESGRFIQQNPEASSEIAVDFLDPQKKLGLNPALIKNVLTQPGGIRTDQLFPVLQDLEVMQRYMSEKMGVGAMINLEKFVDTQFAEAACKPPALVEKPETETITIRTTDSPVQPQSLPAAQAIARNAEAAMLQTTVVAAREGKYLVFKLDAERYGLPIMDVREIIGMIPITPMVLAPRHVKGMVNLRGNIIPIVDLRLRFNLPGREYNERTCIIVVEIAAVGGSQPTGIVVDSVSEVAEIAENVIQDAPEFGSAVDATYIIGMARLSSGVAILLDIEQVLTTSA